MGPPRSIFDPWTPAGTVRNWPSGWTVCYVEETGSTNADVVAALDAGAIGDRTVLAAGYQTAGRGRLDRRWDAPADANLLVTLAFADGASPLGLPTQRVALAALRAVRRWPRADGAVYGLKWPNDLLVRGADGRDHKLAGLLAQRSGGGTAVGIGINVGWAPPDAAMLATGVDGDIDVADVLAALLESFDALPERDDDLHQVYRRDLLTIGASVRVELPDGSTSQGTAVDVDADGRLIVDADGRRRGFDVADIVHLRRVD